MKPDRLFEDIVHWAGNRDDIAGICLVGSHARGTARPDSDFDLVLLCDTPGALLNDRAWISEFGTVDRIEHEDWGQLQALRTFYRDGTEVEFGIAGISWAAIPVDAGTQEVVSDGIKILSDPRGVFRQLQVAISGAAG